jgi:PAP2 superfamily
MNGLRKLTGLSAVICFGFLPNARADVVSDWNLFAVLAINAAGRPPGGSPFLDIATVHLAMHDAVAAIDRQFQPYNVKISGASGSPVAAAAAAAHDVLVNRFPAQAASLDSTYAEYIAAHGLSQKDPGIAVGQQAAAGIIAFRADDGSFPSQVQTPFTGGSAPGQWRPTPPALASMATPWLATVRPFALTSPQQFRANPPPSLNSPLYTLDYNQAKDYGSLTNSKRTPEETDLAYFWSGNYLLVWNSTLRNIATSQKLDVANSARLFALANMAMADAAITAWDSKLFYTTWRPFTAIQFGDTAENPLITGDPTWQPLIVNPPYPEYPSGANNVTGAITRILRSFFGTNEMSFPVTTTVPQAIQQTRTYQRFTDAADEVVIARVFEGIHFAFADFEARKQGESVATWVSDRFLRPSGQQ